MEERGGRAGRAVSWAAAVGLGVYFKVTGAPGDVAHEAASSRLGSIPCLAPDPQLQAGK